MMPEWCSHLKDAEDKERFKQILKENKDILNRLVEILNGRIDTIRAKQLKEADYSNASWASQQADYNGSIRSLNKVIDLLKKSS